LRSPQKNVCGQKSPQKICGQTFAETTNDNKNLRTKMFAANIVESAKNKRTNNKMFAANTCGVHKKFADNVCPQVLSPGSDKLFLSKGKLNKEILNCVGPLFISSLVSLIKLVPKIPPKSSRTE